MPKARPTLIPHCNFGARVGSRFQVFGPNREVRGGLPLERAGVWVYWSSRPCPRRAFCCWICIWGCPFGPRTRDPGLCPDLSRAVGGSVAGAEATGTGRWPGSRFSMCHGQTFQFTSSPLARTAPSRRWTRGRLSSWRLAHVWSCQLHRGHNYKLNRSAVEPAVRLAALL